MMASKKAQFEIGALIILLVGGGITLLLSEIDNNEPININYIGDSNTGVVYNINSNCPIPYITSGSLITFNTIQDIPTRYTLNSCD